MPPKLKKQKIAAGPPLALFDQISQLATNLHKSCHPLSSDEIQIMQQVLKAAYNALKPRSIVVTQTPPILEATLQSLLGCREIAESIFSFLFAEPKAKDSHDRWGSRSSFPILAVSQNFNQSFRACIGFLHLSMNRDRHNKFSKLLPTFPMADSIVITRSGKMSAARAMTDLLDTLMALGGNGTREMRLIGFDRQELNLTQMRKFVQVLKMPSMHNLKTLDMNCMKLSAWYQFGELTEALGSGLILMRLENLSLASNGENFGDSGIVKLIQAWEKSNGSKHIKVLNISSCGLTSLGVNKLITAIDAGLLPSLRALHLGSVQYWAAGRNTCSPADILRLLQTAERGALIGLEELDISSLTLLTETLSAEFESGVCNKGYFPNLKVLTVSYYDITPRERLLKFEAAMEGKLRRSY